MMICLVFIKTKQNKKKNEKSSTSLQNKHQFNLPNIARLFTVHFLEADPNIDKAFWAHLPCQSCLWSPPWYTFMVQLRIMSHPLFFFFFLPPAHCHWTLHKAFTDERNWSIKNFLSHFYRFSSDVFCTISLIILELIFHLLYCTAIEKIYKNKTEVIALMVWGFQQATLPTSSGLKLVRTEGKIKPHNFPSWHWLHLYKLLKRWKSWIHPPAKVIVTSSLFLYF